MIKYFVPVLSQTGRRHGGWSPLSLNERLAAPFNLDTLFQIIAVTAPPIHKVQSLVFKSVNMNECSRAIKSRASCLCCMSGAISVNSKKERVAALGRGFEVIRQMTVF